MLVDARYEKTRRDGIIVDMAVLVAIGVSEQGFRHVLAIETGWGESEEVWSQFIKGLKDRGLHGVELFTSDNHSGIRAALRDHYSGIPWQQCQYHFLQNALDKVPKKREDQIHEALRGIWRKENTYQQAIDRLEDLIEEFSEPLPDVADWLSEDAPSTLTVFQVAPTSHRRRLRTTNAVERLNQELKRRSKPVRIFPNPESCLRLFGAMLKEQHEDWITGRRYLKMGALEEFSQQRKTSTGRGLTFTENLLHKPFVDRVVKERGYEFQMEGKRWFDLVRSGRVFEVMETYIGREVTEKHLLWPIPLEEFDLNEAMDPSDQNPGY